MRFVTLKKAVRFHGFSPGSRFGKNAALGAVRLVGASKQVRMLNSLELQNLGAQIREERRGVGSRPRNREVENANSLQRERHQMTPSAASRSI